MPHKPGHKNGNNPMKDLDKVIAKIPKNRKGRKRTTPRRIV